MQACLQEATEAALNAAKKEAAEAQTRTEHAQQEHEKLRTGFQTKLTQLASQVGAPQDLDAGSIMTSGWCTGLSLIPPFELTAVHP